MSTIFGNPVPSKLYIPYGTADWSIKAHDGTSVFSKGEFANFLLTTFTLSDQEIVDVRRCFDETTHIFAFGRNPTGAIMEIHFTCFVAYKCLGNSAPVTTDIEGEDGADIGEAANLGSAANQLTLDELRRRYGENRVYKNQLSMYINIDTLNVQGYLLQMSIGQVDPETHSCNVTMVFMLEEEV